VCHEERSWQSGEFIQLWGLVSCAFAPLCLE
jgi:hypothetical protein